MKTNLELVKGWYKQTYEEQLEGNPKLLEVVLDLMEKSRQAEREEINELWAKQGCENCPLKDRQLNEISRLKKGIVELTQKALEHSRYSDDRTNFLAFAVMLKKLLEGEE